MKTPIGVWAESFCTQLCSWGSNSFIFYVMINDYPCIQKFIFRCEQQVLGIAISCLFDPLIRTLDHRILDHLLDHFIELRIFKVWLLNENCNFSISSKSVLFGILINVPLRKQTKINHPDFMEMKRCILNSHSFPSIPAGYCRLQCLYCST